MGDHSIPGTMAAERDLGPLPKSIAGGCLCGSLKYKIVFPDNHPFRDKSGTCQCTQCRKGTSSLFFLYHLVPRSAFAWTTPTETLKNYYCTEGNARGFCQECGTFMYWRQDDGPNIGIPIGTVDPLYLFGEGWEESNGEVPRGGFGRALANGGGYHLWVSNEIAGVTDKLDLVGGDGRGTRVTTA